MAQTDPPKPNREISSARNRLESVTLRMIDAGLPPDTEEDETSPESDEYDTASETDGDVTQNRSRTSDNVVDIAKRLGALDLRLEILRRGQKD